MLKSKDLIDNFDYLKGNEKYHSIRNLIAIWLFIRNKKVSNESVDREIKKIFDLKEINGIKENILEKNKFLREYKSIYREVFNIIMRGIKNSSK